MTEYIDKGIAINIIEMTDHTGYSIECVTDITDLAVKAIKEMPTADVVEVVHGKWIKMDKHGRDVQCSKCGNTLDLRGVNAGRGDANYCPNCGAKMERREDAEIH